MAESELIVKKYPGLTHFGTKKDKVPDIAKNRYKSGSQSSTVFLLLVPTIILTLTILVQAFLIVSKKQIVGFAFPCLPFFLCSFLVLVFTLFVHNKGKVT